MVKRKYQAWIPLWGLNMGVNEYDLIPIKWFKFWSVYQMFFLILLTILLAIFIEKL